jgi:formylglycine-generating enzyme required for sulfatase activity
VRLESEVLTQYFLDENLQLGVQTPDQWYERFARLRKLGAAPANPIATHAASAAIKKPATKPAQEPTTTIQAIAPGIELTLVQIAPGAFQMGAYPSEAFANAADTPHTVTITRPFFMGAVEVTQAQYASVMGKNPSRFIGDQLPVDGASYDDAAEFCRLLSRRTGQRFRLPTDAEWEFACRAGTSSMTAAGGDASRINQCAWNGSNAGGTTHPVGTLRPNAWGLYDMVGNLWEWVSDYYDVLPSEPVTDPVGPDAVLTTDHVIRGGCWNTSPRGMVSSWSSLRSILWGNKDLYKVGFRVVMEVPRLQ